MLIRYHGCTFPVALLHFDEGCSVLTLFVYKIAMLMNSDVLFFTPDVGDGDFRVNS